MREKRKRKIKRKERRMIEVKMGEKHLKEK
jgi:hypothetical protein